MELAEIGTGTTERTVERPLLAVLKGERRDPPRQNQHGHEERHDDELIEDGVADPDGDHRPRIAAQEACLGRQLLAFKAKTIGLMHTRFSKVAAFTPSAMPVLAEGVWHIPAVSISICCAGRWLT